VTPYLEGERTPNLPDATASVSGITIANGTRENFARACVEGMFQSLLLGNSLIQQAGHQVIKISVIGGAAANPAVRAVALDLFSDFEVEFPAAKEYVALGAAKQAAAILA
jgi:xylulokinase